MQIHMFINYVQIKQRDLGRDLFLDFELVLYFKYFINFCIPYRVLYVFLRLQIFHKRVNIHSPPIIY